MTPSLPVQTAPHCASFGPPFDERTSARGSGRVERRTRNTRGWGGSRVPTLRGSKTPPCTPLLESTPVVLLLHLQRAKRSLMSESLFRRLAIAERIAERHEIVRKYLNPHEAARRNLKVSESSPVELAFNSRSISAQKLARFRSEIDSKSERGTFDRPAKSSSRRVAESSSCPPIGRPRRPASNGSPCTPSGNASPVPLDPKSITSIFIFRVSRARIRSNEKICVCKAPCKAHSKSPDKRPDKKPSNANATEICRRTNRAAPVSRNRPRHNKTEHEMNDHSAKTERELNHHSAGGNGA